MKTAIAHRLPSDIRWEKACAEGDWDTMCAMVWEDGYTSFYRDARQVFLDKARHTKSSCERDYLMKLVLYVEHRCLRETGNQAFYNC